MWTDTPLNSRPRRPKIIARQTRNPGGCVANRKPIKQSAVLAYQERKNQLQVVLVTSLDTQRWVLPKGHLADGMTPSDSAALEAFEEAGVEGDVSRQSIGSYDYMKTEPKGGGLRRVEVFPMEVSRVRRNWPEKSVRDRKWMPIEDAVRAVEEKKLKKLMAQFGRKMAAG